MIIVTGGAGFIGSNIVKALNRRGQSEILVVDNLTNAEKIANLSELNIHDYMDKDEFFDFMAAGKIIGNLSVVFHQGACSDTMATDGKYVLHNNYTCSKLLFHFCRRSNAQFLYASSASVYGGGGVFEERPENESALNAYAWSKLLFDNYIRLQTGTDAQCAGLRYFNVYGPGEFHKGRGASVIWHFHNQYIENNSVNLFHGTDGYKDGEQLRDFVFIDDVVEVNLYLMDHPQISGIYNVGTGAGRSFNDVALAVVNFHRRARGQHGVGLSEAVASGEIKYIPMPEALIGKYQSYTRANLTKLRAAGCQWKFHNIDAGVERYLSSL